MKRYIQQLVRIYALIKIKEGNTNYYYPSNRLNFIKKRSRKSGMKSFFARSATLYHPTRPI